MPALDQPGDDLEHALDVPGRPRIGAGGPDVEERDVSLERARVVVGDLLRRPLLQPGADQHLVLAAIEVVLGQVADVGDVHHLPDVVAAVLEDAAEEVGEQERAQVADVHVAVHGGAAGIDAHAPGLERPELFLAPGQRVVHAHGRGQGRTYATPGL